MDASPTRPRRAIRSSGMIVLALLPFVLGSRLDAQAKTVQVQASTRYERNRIHQFTFGGGYRELWKAPIELPVLDLAKEGGGLTPTRRFGASRIGSSPRRCCKARWPLRRRPARRVSSRSGQPRPWPRASMP